MLVAVKWNTGVVGNVGGRMEERGLWAGVGEETNVARRCGLEKSGDHIQIIYACLTTLGLNLVCQSWHPSAHLCLAMSVKVLWNCFTVVQRTAFKGRKL